MRTGAGPAFIECHTYRWREHVGPGEDYDDGYRNRAELDPWQRTDPVAAAAAKVDAKRREAIDRDIEAEIAAAIDFAEKAEWPPASELLHNAYAE
jgi:pyruvate dehydrogenase E1 component alpha subunit